MIRKYINITKVDDEQRIVGGYASTPDLDSQGDVVSIEAIKKALPEYLEFPTIRRMHNNDAIGTTLTTKIDDKGLYIEAKIVDEDAWKKVKEGVYRGFSIGGKVINKIREVITDLRLVEISLVDVPANKQAKVLLFKGDLKKDASSVVVLADLLCFARDLMLYMEYREKDTTKLSEIVEKIKEIIVNEAQEPEKVKEVEDEMEMLFGELAVDFTMSKFANFVGKNINLIK